MKRIIFILFVLILTCFGKAVGQEYKAEAYIDSTSVLIGDHFRLNLDFTFPSDAKVFWPSFGDTLLRNMIILKKSAIDSVYSTDRKSLHLHQQLLLTCFDSGFYTIPPIRFHYNVPPDTTLEYAQSKLIYLSVNSLKVDTTQAIKPIKGPMKVPLTFREILPWLLGGIFVAGLIYAVIYIIRKRKKAEPVFALKPRILLKPHEVALAELEKLKAKKLWQEGRIKEYHSELTEIIRKYIEDRFQVKALESTTWEIYSSLKELGKPESGLLETMHRILMLADMVKFAKERPLPDENERSMQQAVAFIMGSIEKQQDTAPAIEESTLQPVAGEKQGVMKGKEI